MSNDLFVQLLESVREGAAILRGETLPSSRFEIAAAADSEQSHDGRPS